MVAHMEEQCDWLGKAGLDWLAGPDNEEQLQIIHLKPLESLRARM